MTRTGTFFSKFKSSGLRRKRKKSKCYEENTDPHTSQESKGDKEKIFLQELSPQEIRIKIDEIQKKSSSQLREIISKHISDVKMPYIPDFGQAEELIFKEGTNGWNIIFDYVLERYPKNEWFIHLIKGDIKIKKQDGKIIL